MRLKIVILVSLFGALSSQAFAGYRTYVQANKSTDKNKSFVIVMVSDPESKKPKLDIAQSYFTLSNNETKTAAVGNKYFPAREYRFSVSLKRPIVTITVVISENGQELFRTNEQFASWGGL